MLEFEWVMRDYYGFTSAETVAVLRHLAGLPNVTVEDRATVEQALSHCDAGIDLADALHHASYRGCVSMASLDNRKFGRRAKMLGLAPAVLLSA